MLGAEGSPPEPAYNVLLFFLSRFALAVEAEHTHSL